MGRSAGVGGPAGGDRRLGTARVRESSRSDGAALALTLDEAYQEAYAVTYGIGRPPMTSITATEARKQLYKLLDDVSDSHEPVQITGRRGNAVLVGEDDWRAVQETLYLVSIPGMRESILEGLATPVDECADKLDW